MSSRAKSAKPATSAVAVRIEPDEAAAIGTLLLLDRLESAGPIGRISYYELRQHKAGAILISDESEEDLDPIGD